MRDIGILVPTRKRRDNAARLIKAVADTALLQTDIIFAIDDDDPSYEGLLREEKVAAWVEQGNIKVERGARRTCPEWTNQLALKYAGEYKALASFGDDHAPETPYWDSLMLAALDELGTGMVYGNDTLQGANLPTAPVISSEAIVALGWMFLPGLIHFFADNVIKDIFEMINRSRYLPEVTIRHYHYVFGTAPPDITYAEAAPAWGHDEPFYFSWRGRDDGLKADAERVRRLLDQPREVRA